MGDINESERSEAGGLHDLPQLNSAINSNRRERPPMINLSTGDVASRVPLRQPKVLRKDSKGGLRGMFTRNKTEKAVVISPLIEETPSLSGFSERSMKAAAEANLPRSLSMKMVMQKAEKPTPVTEIIMPATPAQSTAKASRMNLRSKSVKSMKTPSKPTPKSPSTKSSPRPPTRTSAAWDPPPLFQAYPQAIKHAQLSASTLSADAILRMSNHKRNNSLRDEIAQVEATDLTSAAARKAEKAKSKHKRQISGSLSKADWTQKIFVLVTSGYLLQYAGDGSFDRLPEKMMQLGKDSVAFASDVIPGKHWVLQISQAMDSDGTPASDSRSLLSRLAFRGADYRRSATSLLLVLNSAEDMDSWIAVVRREIEALGGKKHVSETGKPKPDDKVMQLRAQPSHRYLIHRNTDETSNPASPQIPSFGPPPWVKEKDNELQKKLEEATSELIRPQSSSVRPSTSYHSRAGSVTSNDGRQLESLRDSSNRFSYVSSGQRTLITSQDSSPATSPTRESGNFDDIIPKPSIEDLHLRPNAAAVNERRRSMQTMHAPLLEPQATAKLHRHSTYGGPANPSRSRSPGLTPNFSVPNSSIKRYSMAKSPSPTPPVPSKTLGSGQRDSILRGPRKAPPSALHVPRPLSPVKASPKKAAPMIVMPVDSDPISGPSTTQSFSLVQNAKLSVITIPPRSPTTPSNAMPTPPPRRMSSLTPLAPHEAAHIDFHLPRRYSSMQTLREISEKHALNNNNLDAPLRPAPLPPAALSTPLPSSPFVSTFELPISTTQQSQSQRHGQDQTQNHSHSHSQRPRSRASARSPQPVPVLVPALANTKSKVKRPISMQIAPAAAHRNNPYLSLKTKSPHIASQANTLSPRPFSSSSNTSSTSTLYSHSSTNGHVLTPLTSVSMLSPGLQRVKEHEISRTVINRRSMPALVNGPPPAPPPDCALPPIPPPGSSRGSVGSRGSLVR
ncbi:hypothetical protein ONS95_012581 [Cadophora gregata]|uniref:uncharacterized protein n=1 Tax=Cadophora gregata TaxID=51156 RepID=UPI0026DBF22E|nr:uncharacterized protein ONS95_012581 [Cadophora gregata]KAK0118284.1 hypothetical protein ONS95_012581 [Cadophora gregata]KAK0123353.1 hypothetical protein ONS96_010346 [Cadophora gregata f. sp. sojae]